MHKALGNNNNNYLHTHPQKQTERERARGQCLINITKICVKENVQ